MAFLWRIPLILATEEIQRAWRAASSERGLGQLTSPEENDNSLAMFIFPFPSQVGRRVPEYPLIAATCKPSKAFLLDTKNAFPKWRGSSSTKTVTQQHYTSRKSQLKENKRSWILQKWCIPLPVGSVFELEEEMEFLTVSRDMNYDTDLRAPDDPAPLVLTVI